MMYRVIDTTTGKDITYDYDWVISPSGELNYLYYCDLVGYPNAKAVPIISCWDIP